jgi:hypothetical protein
MWPLELLHQPRHQRKRRGESGRQVIHHAQASIGRGSTTHGGGGFTTADVNAQGGRGAAVVDDKVDSQGASGSGNRRRSRGRRRDPWPWRPLPPNSRGNGGDRVGHLMPVPDIGEGQPSPLPPPQMGEGNGHGPGIGVGEGATQGGGRSSGEGGGWAKCTTGTYIWDGMDGGEWWGACDEVQGIYDRARLGVHSSTAEGTGRRRSSRTNYYRSVAEQSVGSSSNMSGSETEEGNEPNRGIDDVNAVKYIYADETWSQKFFTYDPKPRIFVGRRGPTEAFHQVPSIAHLFDLFWLETLLHKIVTETNRYATHPLDAMGNTMGGRNWENMTIAELKAFLAVHMYMGMKRQPNVQSYWEKEGSIFHCHVISNIMSCDRF